MQLSQQDYYRYLRVGKLAGSLTPYEEKLFEQLLQQDADFASEFVLLQEKFPSKKLTNLEKYKDNEQWGYLMSQVKTIDKPLITSGRVSIALGLFTVLSLGGWFLFSQKESIAVIPPTVPGIELKLADGKVISLSDSSGSINTETALINNTGDSLTYSVGQIRNAGMNTLTIASGLDYKIVLNDGTKIWMNSTTRLDFPFVFNDSTREISINGEAYLEVARDSRKPFILHLPKSVVKVLGTEFNVNTYQADMNIVSLINGSVAMKGGSAEIILQPGKEGVFSRNNMVQRPFDKAKTLSWQHGLLYFSGTPLAEIADIVSRWFKVKTVIDNSRNDDKLFVGVVNKNRPLSVFLKDLQSVADIVSYFDEDGVLHFK